MSVGWLIFILLLAVPLAWPQLRKVIREGRQRDIIEQEARAEAVRQSLMGEYPTQGFQAIWDETSLPPYQYWAE